MKTALINLDDYTEEEKQYCTMECNYLALTTQDLRELCIYKSDANRIIASYIFEKMTDSSASTTEMMTEKEADEYIQKYISER